VPVSALLHLGNLISCQTVIMTSVMKSVLQRAADKICLVLK